MKVKVKYSDLKVTCNNITKKTNELAMQIDTLGKTLEELKSIWQGIDGMTFYNNSINYVKDAQKIPQTYNTLVKQISTLNEKYEEVDERRNFYYEPVVGELIPHGAPGSVTGVMEPVESERKMVSHEKLINGTAAIYDAGTGQYLDVYQSADGNYVTDGKMINGTAAIYDAGTGQYLNINQAADGSYVATDSMAMTDRNMVAHDKMVKGASIYDAGTGEYLNVNQADGVSYSTLDTMAMSDRDMVAHDKMVKGASIYDAGTGEYLNVKQSFDTRGGA